MNHATRTLAAATQVRDGEPHGAFEATIYVPIEGAPNPAVPVSNIALACDAAGIDNAYAWMVGEGVRTSYESYACGDPTTDGLAQDWYSRYFDILPFKSSGNLAEEERSDEGAIEQPACAFTLSSVCVGATDDNYDLAAFSKWGNPSTGMGDRDEPDIVALGEGVDVVINDVANDTDFGVADGTSFAAPSAASLAVLFREYCDIDWKPRELRTIMVHSGAWRNVHGPRHSTPGLDDYRDGGGFSHAEELLKYCNSEPGRELVHGGGALDPGSTTPLPGPIDGYEGHEPISGRLPIGSTGSGRWGEIAHTVELFEGEEVRVTLSWDPCPTGSMGMAPAAVATDIDVHLCLPTGECVGVSQSFMHNVERFEGRVPTDGVYELWVSHEDGAGTCDGGPEPYYWALQIR